MDVAAGLPEGAVRVRADEARPGEWRTEVAVYGSDGFVCSVHGRYPHALPWHAACMHIDFEHVGDDTVISSHAGPLPEPTVTLTITLPETKVRSCGVHRAEWGDDPYGFALFEDACIEWRSANPQDERNEP